MPPEAAPALGVAVIAHPHPLFGGTMDNKVVQTLARAFVGCGWTALRFNFRGVGASEGVHDEGRGECEDMRAVVAQLAPEGPLAIAGFSFGAFVASCAIDRLWAARDIRQVVLVGTAASRFSVAALPPEAHERALVVHGEQDDTVPLAAVHGLGAAAVTSCHSRSRGRPFLSRTIAAAQESGRPPSARGLVSFPHESFRCRRCARSQWLLPRPSAWPPGPRCRRRPRWRPAASC